MDGPREYGAKWNMFERARQILYDFIYVWNLKSKINEWIKQKQIHKTDWQLPEGKGVGGLGNIGEGINYKSVVTK